ncbi:PilZ domain-containing protein [Dechloromonas sp. ZS-1]|uniref:PilZ domain-containing protein n=1 Tax=Dechloromonas sp. ZS-1 TaxID=3138067 RepID=UPI0031FE3C76
MPFSDRRTDSRFRINTRIPAAIENAERGYRCLGELRDISRSGCQIEILTIDGDPRLQDATTLEFAYHGNLMKLQGKIARQLQIGNKGFGYGIRFTHKIDTRILDVLVPEEAGVAVVTGNRIEVTGKLGENVKRQLFSFSKMLRRHTEIELSNVHDIDPVGLGTLQVVLDYGANIRNCALAVQGDLYRGGICLRCSSNCAMSEKAKRTVTALTP